jgi:MFS transporter, OFA family, oxalate/formate antiporter
MAPAYLILLFFIPNYASTISLFSQMGSTLVTVLSAVNGLGRLLVGLISDHIGLLNVLTLSYAISGISAFFWPFVKMKWALYLIVVAHGTLSGAFFALVGPATVQMAGVENMTAAINFLYLAVAIGGSL